MCQNCNDFVHLHVHSEYSLLDGLSRINDLANRAVELGQPAIALTDHGTMYGTIDFYRACKKAGVKPIIGLETYVANRRMTDMNAAHDRKRFHALFLAKNQTGWLNLLKVASESQLKGYYYKPRIDHEFMAAHSKGIISTSGCMAAEIPQAILNGQMDKAHELMGFYLDTFGRDNFFLELQEHNIPELTKINQQLIEMAPRYGLQDRFLATNDVHYTHASEAAPHEVLLCIQTGSTTKAPKLTFSDHDYYLKSAEEMSTLFNGYNHEVVANALQNSVAIAEMCEVDLDPKGYHLPVFDVPEGYDAHGFLRELCFAGLSWRYGADRADNDEGLHNRLNHELNIIHRMGFDTYFLIVWDLCEFARRSERWWDKYGATFYPDQTFEQWRKTDIWWNVRGSGAGSVVAYSLGITGIDPIKNALIFERFLNPGRVSMPDFDLDYPDDRRPEMVEYTMRRYGADKVAQIITFGTMKARAAIRDVGRATDMALERVDQIARMIPAIPGKKVKIKNLFEEEHEFYNKEFVELYNRDATAKELIDTAQQLEGVSRHASSHAAGVIVSDKPLVEYCPLNKPTSGDAGLGGVDRVTQWPMEIVESMGLLKVDFLGLSTLTIMRYAVQLVEERHGVKYEMDSIPYDVGHIGPDPAKKMEDAFNMLTRGDVAGVFQVEGAGMRRLMMEMKPSRFDHIIAAISLYRPGPMDNIPSYIRRMHGEEDVTYHHPSQEPILGDTYGICVYQEQIIRMASELAGYDPGEADMLRRAVSKKKEKEMKIHSAKFMQGAMERGITEAEVTAIWEDIKFFARYGFNKAHAADYAVITCQTAFLKAHYPVEYMTALLSVEREKTEKVTRYLAEAKRLGIKVSPPDINHAQIPFAIEDLADGRSVIRFGFGAIKNAGEAALQLVINEREANGPFKNVQDLCERVDLRRVGSRAIESMIKVGVFDIWGTRPQFIDGMRRMINYSGKHIDEKSSAQMSLFGMFTTPTASADPDLLHPEGKIKQYEPRELLDWEKELIGVYLSEHPLERQLGTMSRYISHGSAAIDTNMNGKQVSLGGIIASIRPYTTKKGDPMAFGVLEDLDGKIDLVFFPRTWTAEREKAQVDQIALVKGKVNVKDDSISVIVDTVLTNLTIASAASDQPQRAVGQRRFDSAQPAPADVETDEWAPKSWDDLGDEDETPVAIKPEAATVVTKRQPITMATQSQPTAAVIEPAHTAPKSAEPATPPIYPETPQAPPLRIAETPPPVFEDNGTPEPEWSDDWGFETLPAKTAPAPKAAHTPPPRAEQIEQSAPPPPPPIAANGQHTNGQATTATPHTNGQHNVPTNRQPQLMIVEVSVIDRWRDTFRHTLRLAEQYSGHDSLEVHLMGENLLMRFPEKHTHFCSELARDLEKIVGVQRVYVQQRMF